MCSVAVGDDVRLPGGEGERPPVTQLGEKLPFQDEDDVAALAPMVGDVPRRILDDARANVSALDRPPRRGTGIARVCCWRNGRPVHSLKRDVLQAHALRIERPARGLKRAARVTDRLRRVGPLV